jgi:hypothetical protein
VHYNGTKTLKLCALQYMMNIISLPGELILLWYIRRHPLAFLLVLPLSLLFCHLT